MSDFDDTAPAPQPQEAAPVPQPVDPLQQLERLGALKVQSVLTGAEFDAQKQRF